MVHVFAASSHNKITFAYSRMNHGEVYLYWDGGTLMKSQRALARGAKLGHKEDLNLLNYYKCVGTSLVPIINTYFQLCNGYGGSGRSV